MTEDEVAEVRKKHQLSIDGADCPKPITQFNQVRENRPHTPLSTQPRVWADFSQSPASACMADTKDVSHVCANQSAHTLVYYSRERERKRGMNQWQFFPSKFSTFCCDVILLTVLSSPFQGSPPDHAQTLNPEP
jgi:hypothetical protein